MAGYERGDKLKGNSMEKETFTLEVEKQLKQAHARGFRYLVTVYRDCLLGKKRKFISYHYNIADAKQLIGNSPYRESLVFQDISLLIKKPEYFFLT